MPKVRNTPVSPGGLIGNGLRWPHANSLMRHRSPVPPRGTLQRSISMQNCQSGMRVLFLVRNFFIELFRYPRCNYTPLALALDKINIFNFNKYENKDRILCFRTSNFDAWNYARGFDFLCVIILSYFNFSLMLARLEYSHLELAEGPKGL